VIKALVLDFGGVMTTSTMPERVRPIAEAAGIDWGALERGYARYRRLMDADFMTMEEMYSRIWDEAGVRLDEGTSRRIVEADVASFLYPNLRTLEWMRETKAAGFRIGILTNMSTKFAGRFRAAFPDFIALADAMVVSGEEKIYKPMREIYDLTAARLGLAPEEICFTDDSEDNCRGAREAGWSAIRFTGTEQARREFAALTAAAAGGGG
jgi:epoxide hydrolase-like predicted phosphatase